MTAREKLIQAGVRNLVEYGYPHCDSENILTDMIYSRFFESMLRENKGHGREIDDAIDGLVKEIASKRPKELKEPKGTKKAGK